MKTLYKITLFCALLFSAGAVFAQQTEREKGIELYKKGSFKESVAVLGKFVKSTPNDAEARTFLALSQMKIGKLKEAAKMLDKSLELNPNQANARKAYAYVLLLRGKTKESIDQIANLKAMQPQLDAESFYILGWAYLRFENYDEALENAEQAARLNPKMPEAYYLKAQAIMNRRSGATDYGAIAEKYGSAADNIGKFIVLSAALPDAPYWKGQQETLKIFAAYYTEKEKNKNAADATADAANSTPLKIIAKPRASYTDQARQAGISGTIRLMVAFTETGKIENVLVLTSLGYGLDEEAVKAAKGIKYEPEMRNGKPVTAVKTVEYTFTIY
jgi:TonB family protein